MGNSFLDRGVDKGRERIRGLVYGVVVLMRSVFCELCYVFEYREMGVFVF